MGGMASAWAAKARDMGFSNIWAGIPNVWDTKRRYCVVVPLTVIDESVMYPVTYVYEFKSR